MNLSPKGKRVISPTSTSVVKGELNGPTVTPTDLVAQRRAMLSKR